MQLAMATPLTAAVDAGSPQNGASFSARRELGDGDEGKKALKDAKNEVSPNTALTGAGELQAVLLVHLHPITSPETQAITSPDTINFRHNVLPYGSSFALVASKANGPVDVTIDGSIAQRTHTK
ncbi:hypothetical protein QJQ45_027896 [Haematococcus lacustris]|nr:hypothetical protein QJQ45_027896 [Haematococcus lacustris]